MLRDEFQMALRELQGMAQELLERLESFDVRALSTNHADALEVALKRRRELIERLAGCSRTRGDLPGEGNLERAQFASVIDHLLDEAGMHHGALRRLASGERALVRRIDELAELKWSGDERAALHALTDNARAIDDLLTEAAE